MPISMTRARVVPAKIETQKMASIATHHSTRENTRALSVAIFDDMTVVLEEHY